MSEWQSYLLGQMSSDLSEIKSDVHALKAKVETVTSWLQRIALLIVLWGGAIVTNVAPDKAGEILATLLKSLK